MKKILFALFLVTTVAATGVLAQSTRSKTGRKTTVTKKKRPIVKKKMVNNNAVTTESGLTYIITKKGDGEQVLAGQTVSVNYTGMLTNGEMFDSSLTRNQPFSFKVGAGMVIKGWDEGLQKLRVGDHAILTIPSSIGYGERGAGGVIPPNATLIFIIEVLDTK